MKRLIFFLLAAALFSSPAFAAQNVGNTSQKGSLLIFPLIDVRAENNATTIVDISNDGNLGVHLECSYINDKKGRVDFDFLISPKGSVSWDVLTHTLGPPFPSNGTFPQGSAAVGELICFAVDAAVHNQVRFNHLTGVATVVNFNDADASQTKQAFKYNAWAFTARTALTPPPPDGSPVGTAGDLQLTGGGDGTYDACPLYLIANFSPGGLSSAGTANTLGGVSYIDNDLNISSCNQDLRQDFHINLTKLKFTVWNAFEESFTGAYQCSDSVLTFGLEADQVPVNFDLSNFNFSTLQTHNARVEIDGISSTQCPGSAPTGLVGVLTTSIAISPNTTSEDAEIGNTIHGAGAESGFVLWDPRPAIVPETTHQR